MKVYLDLDDDGIVKSWGSTESPGSTPTDLDINNPLLARIGSIRYVDGKLIKDDDRRLEDAKVEKNLELNAKCKAAILEGFTHTIDDVTYWFSYDMEAQGNFRDAKEVLKDGLVDVMPWTVRKGGIDGEYNRLIVDLDLINELSIVIMHHKTGLISKYRDFLMPLVNECKTIEELESIQW